MPLVHNRSVEPIGPLQLRVMHHIWTHGASTVHGVRNALNAEAGQPRLAYTTFLSVLRNLSRRKMLSQTSQGRNHLFEPLIDEVSYKLSILRVIRRDLFAGDMDRMVGFIAQDVELEHAGRDQPTTSTI